jgi:hypothetical protein
MSGIPVSNRGNRHWRKVGKRQCKQADSVCQQQFCRASGATEDRSQYDTISPLAVGGLGKSDACQGAKMIQWTLVAKASRTVADGQGSRDEASQRIDCDRPRAMLRFRPSGRRCRCQPCACPLLPAPWIARRCAGDRSHRHRLPAV